MPRKNARKSVVAQVSQPSSKKSVKEEKSYSIKNGKLSPPGEFTVAQCRHFKAKPSVEIIDSIEDNIGRLIRHDILRESLAVMVANRKPYRHEITKQDIKGTCEITEYTPMNEYLQRVLKPCDLAAVEHLALVMVQKQLRINLGPDYQVLKSVFVNENMIPKWKCSSFRLMPKTKVEDVYDEIDRLMAESILLDLKISIVNMENDQESSEVVFWTKVVDQRAAGIYDAKGFYGSKYPKIIIE